MSASPIIMNVLLFACSADWLIGGVEAIRCSNQQGRSDLRR
jgi:hypothetical protein